MSFAGGEFSEPILRRDRLIRDLLNRDARERSRTPRPLPRRLPRRHGSIAAEPGSIAAEPAAKPQPEEVATSARPIRDRDAREVRSPSPTRAPRSRDQLRAAVARELNRQAELDDELHRQARRDANAFWYLTQPSQTDIDNWQREGWTRVDLWQVPEMYAPPGIPLRLRSHIHGWHQVQSGEEGWDWIFHNRGTDGGNMP